MHFPRSIQREEKFTLFSSAVLHLKNSWAKIRSEDDCRIRRKSIQTFHPAKFQLTFEGKPFLVRKWRAFNFGDMANRIGQALRRFTPYSKSQSFGQLVRRSLFSSWGGTYKGRELSYKILGFSAASLALFGLEVKDFKRNRLLREGTDRDNNFWRKRVEERGKANLASYFFPSRCEELERSSYTIQPCKNDTVPSMGSRLLAHCRFILTPVSCAGGGGQDEICNCNSCAAERAKAAPVEMCESPPPPDPNPPPAKKNQCDQAKIQDLKSKVVTPSGKVSNKTPCGGYSQCGRASDAGVDIESLSKELGGVKQMDWSMESDLSHCLLMRQATQLAVDAVTRIITEAISAYDDYHSEYKRMLDLMMQALEESRTACGQDTEMIECKIILIRAKVDEMKRKIMDIDMFLGSLEKLCHSMAEAAFMSHAEYASIAMSERQQSMCCEVKRLRAETREKEKDMLELQSLIIVETGKSLK